MHSYVYIYVCVYITGEFHNSFETNKICARPNGNPCPLVWGSLHSHPVPDMSGNGNGKTFWM